MNKIKFFLAAAVVLMAASVNAQQKIGYISINDVMRLMPETQKIQPVMEKFQADSLNGRIQYTLSEYQRKDSILKGKDSTKYPAAARAKMREEMENDMYEIQNWQQISQQLMEQKQNQLLEPIYTKAYQAVQTVAKENGYTYVLTRDALLVFPPADDLLPLVAKKLNLTIPGGAPAAARPAGGPAATNTPGRKQ